MAVRIAMLWFLISVTASMAMYPGSTRLDPTSVGYSFTENAFSDLGRTFTRSGADNRISAALFISALVPIALTLVVFFIKLVPLVSPPGWRGWVGRLGCLAGIVAGLGYIGVALTPANVLPREHVMFVNVAFRSFLAASVLLALATGGIPAFRARATAVWWSFGVLLLAFILIGIFGPRRNTQAGLVIQTVAQKIIVLSGLTIVAFQTFEVERARQRLQQERRANQPAALQAV